MNKLEPYQIEAALGQLAGIDREAQLAKLALSKFNEHTQSIDEYSRLAAHVTATQNCAAAVAGARRVLEALVNTKEAA